MAKYHDARTLIPRFLTGDLDEDALLAERGQLASDRSGTDWAAKDRRLSVLAIDRFLDLVDQIRLEGVLRSGSEIPGVMQFGGVDVSVRPDVIVRSSSGGNRIGAIKLVFAKTVPVGEEAGAYISAALAEHLTRICPDSVVNRAWCQVVDVMHGKVIGAPRTLRNRVADIEAACEEIGSSWRRALQL